MEACPVSGPTVRARPSQHRSNSGTTHSGLSSTSSSSCSHDVYISPSVLPSHRDCVVLEKFPTKNNCTHVCTRLYVWAEAGTPDFTPLKNFLQMQKELSRAQDDLVEERKQAGFDQGQGASFSPSASRSPSCPHTADVSPSKHIRRVLSSYSFPLDGFQQVAATAALLGESSFVFAHTSAGKSLVAELYIQGALRNHSVNGHSGDERTLFDSRLNGCKSASASSYSSMRETLTTESEGTATPRPRVLFLSPLKALSNQKFRELRSIWGDEGVGLLTGDEQRNLRGQQGIVVATVEIVRNDLLRCGTNSSLLSRVQMIVFDEFHFLSDPERGTVWEELLVLLRRAQQVPTRRSPLSFQSPTRSCVFLFLSASVRNPVGFASWFTVLFRQPLHLIGTLRRPVPLEHSVLLGTSSSFSDRQSARLCCIAEERAAVVHAGEGTESVKPDHQGKEDEGVHDISRGQTHSPDEIVCDSWSERTFREQEYINAVRDAAEDQGISKKGSVSKQKESRRFPGDVSVEAVINAVTACKERDLLPALAFCFSRKQCLSLATAVVPHISALVPLVVRHQLSCMYTAAEAGTSALETTWFSESTELHWREKEQTVEQLACLKPLFLRGVGVHHAGLTPAVKDLMELAFERGLLRIVFCTETVSAGLNLPARSVVFTSLFKPSAWGGLHRPRAGFSSGLQLQNTSLFPRRPGASCFSRVSSAYCSGHGECSMRPVDSHLPEAQRLSPTGDSALRRSYQESCCLFPTQRTKVATREAYFVNPESRLSRHSPWLERVDDDWVEDAEERDSVREMPRVWRMLTRTEFEQMAGRAGRRGIDDKGSTILVLPLPAPPPSTIAFLFGAPFPAVRGQMELSFQSLLLADRAYAYYTAQAPDKQHTDKDADTAPGPGHDPEQEKHDELNENEDYWGTRHGRKKGAKGESEGTGGQPCTRKSSNDEEGLTGRITTEGKERGESLARTKEKEGYGERHREIRVDRQTDEDRRRDQDEKILSKKGGIFERQVSDASEEELDESRTEGQQEDNDLNKGLPRNRSRIRQRRPEEQPGHVSDLGGASNPLHTHLDRHRDAERTYCTSETRLSQGQDSSGSERKTKRHNKRSEQGNNLVSSSTRRFRRERRAERATRQFLTGQVADTLFSSFKFFTAAMHLSCISEDVETLRNSVRCFCSSEANNVGDVEGMRVRKSESEGNNKTSSQREGARYSKTGEVHAVGENIEGYVMRRGVCSSKEEIDVTSVNEVRRSGMASWEEWKRKAEIYVGLERARDMCRRRLQRHVRLSGSFLPFLQAGRLVLLSGPRLPRVVIFPRNKPADGLRQVQTETNGVSSPYSDESEIENATSLLEDGDILRQRSTECPYEELVSDLTCRLLSRENRPGGRFCSERIWGWGVVLGTAQVRPHAANSQRDRASSVYVDCLVACTFSRSFSAPSGSKSSTSVAIHPFRSPQRGLIGFSETCRRRHDGRVGTSQQDGGHGAPVLFLDHMPLSRILGEKEECGGTHLIQNAPEAARDVVIEAAEKASEAWVRRLDQRSRSRRGKEGAEKTRGEKKGVAEEKRKKEQEEPVQIAVLPFSADSIVAVSQIVLDLKGIVSLDLRREEDRLSVFISMAEALRTATPEETSLPVEQASKGQEKPAATEAEKKATARCPCGVLCMHKESTDEGKGRRVPLISLLNVEGKEVEQDKLADTKLRKLHRRLAKAQAKLDDAASEATATCRKGSTDGTSSFRSFAFLSATVLPFLEGLMVRAPATEFSYVKRTVRSLLHLGFFRLETKKDNDCCLLPSASGKVGQGPKLLRETRKRLVPTKKGRLAGRLFYFKERCLVLAEILKAIYFRARHRQVGLAHNRRTGLGRSHAKRCREDVSEEKADRPETREKTTSNRVVAGPAFPDDRELESENELIEVDGVKSCIPLLPFGADGPIILAVVCSGLCGESFGGGSGQGKDIKGPEEGQLKRELGVMKKKTNVLRIGDMRSAQERQLEEQHDMDLALRLIRNVCVPMRSVFQKYRVPADLCCRLSYVDKQAMRQVYELLRGWSDDGLPGDLRGGAEPLRTLQRSAAAVREAIQAIRVVYGEDDAAAGAVSDLLAEVHALFRDS
ncbi:dead deah box helicase domain-containing [Cystoisospora suis]|uniref:Dead deah box helicase domain-containing n=1 Tax=Cystoisospora suis TaxID=483139 RepID=A0A2C6LBS2_9APIC|nr:dead deah box helicase domain-containing [Cystoisospora suis]